MYYQNSGCIISASNTVTDTGIELNYIRMAEVSASRIKYFLNVPVVLLTTDDYTSSQYFDSVIRIDTVLKNNRVVISSKETIKYNWKNDMRILAYDLTPFDKTLMIDADYFVNTDNLKVWLDNDLPFMIYNHTYDPTGRNLYRKNFANTKIDQCWATAIAWDKTTTAKKVFEIAAMVRDNYDYYSLVFDWPQRPFRNDLAFTVANHLLKLNYNVLSQQKLANLYYDCDLLDFRNAFIYRYNDKVQTYSGDLHVMNKNITSNNVILDKLEVHSVKTI